MAEEALAHWTGAERSQVVPLVDRCCLWTASKLHWKLSPLGHTLLSRPLGCRWGPMEAQQSAPIMLLGRPLHCVVVVVVSWALFCATGGSSSPAGRQQSHSRALQPAGRSTSSAHSTPPLPLPLPLPLLVQSARGRTMDEPLRAAALHEQRRPRWPVGSSCKVAKWRSAAASLWGFRAREPCLWLVSRRLFGRPDVPLRCGSKSPESSSERPSSIG